jgi:glycosyltransferase involved in cell wall biosynthesis
MSVYIDLTEFLSNSLLSGIQRVTAQLCHHWPGSDLRPVRLTRAGHLTEVDVTLLKAVAASFECRDGSARRAILPFRELDGPPLRLQNSDTVLVPELFYDHSRVAYYKNVAAEELNRYRFIIYDLTPIVRPEFFPDAAMDVICGYFQMVRRFPHCGFISLATQQAFCGKLLRSSRLTGSVLRLGSDGLGPRPQNVAFQRPLKFTVVGRVEPSKNPALVMEAFEPLLSRIPGLQLTFLGKVGHIENELAQKIARMSQDPLSGLEHRSEPDDDQLRRCIDESRATIFVSGAEGFGLPPVESLWRGTPVIVSPGIPSVETIGSTGLHLVDPLTVEGLRKAVFAFLDDSYLKQKAVEALGLALPTWRSFAAEVAQWCRSPGERRVESGRED